MTLDRIFLYGLAFTPLALIALALGASPAVLFALSGLAIIPLAKFLSDATETLSERAGPAVGGLLNATFGNAPELIIGVIALSAGLVDVVKASILGSILGNLLFVLGIAVFAGGVHRKRQTFNVTAARAGATVLILSAAALVIPALFFLSGYASPARTEELSLVVAGLLILVYGAYLLFTLRTHRHLYAEAATTLPEGSEASSWRTLAILLLSTLGVAVMSELFVETIEPVIRGFGWTELFVGAIVIAIIGNAGEHVSAVTAAVHDKMHLALQITMGSATQIVMLVMPLLVLVGAFFPHKLTLVFSTFELSALVFAILLANSVIEDGETNWFEGFMLLVVYLIMGMAFFLLPA